MMSVKMVRNEVSWLSNEYHHNLQPVQCNLLLTRNLNLRSRDGNTRKSTLSITLNGTEKTTKHEIINPTHPELKVYVAQ